MKRIRRASDELVDKSKRVQHMRVSVPHMSASALATVTKYVPENDVVDEQEASAASSSATTSATSAQPQAPQRFDAELPRPLARPKPVQERRLPPLTRIFIVDKPGKMVTGLVQRDENGQRCQQGRRVTRRFEDLSEFDKQQVNRFLSRAGLARKKRSS